MRAVCAGRPSDSLASLGLTHSDMSVGLVPIGGRRTDCVGARMHAARSGCGPCCRQASLARSRARTERVNKRYSRAKAGYMS